MIQCLSTLCALLLSAAAFAADGVTIVAAGKTGVIVIPASLAANANAGRIARAPETLNAALDLSRCIGRITGQPLPVVADGVGIYEPQGPDWKYSARPTAALPAGAPQIHVGWTRRALKEVDKAKVDKLDIDGFLIKSTPEVIFLVGPKDWSTAYAVYTFLEDFCGARWFMPGDLGEDLPQRPQLTVPVVEKTYQPAYLHRQYSGFQFRDDFTRYEWGLRQKVRARLEYHHNLYKVFDVAKYGQKYPDLFPVLKGERRLPGPNNSGAWQPCLSNPKAVEVAMEYARDYFNKNPDAASISLGINDGGGYCECPECMKLIPPDAPRTERRSVWYFQFANKVAEGFDREFPDKVIGFLLYGECHLPTGMKISPRLIGFEVFPSYRLMTEEGRAEFDKRLDNLSQVCPAFALYDWFYGTALFIPRLQIRPAKYWLQHGYEKGARHVKAEAYMNWALDGFKYWMHTKLMWDPSLDVDAMMEDFLTRFFRESADPLRRYFKIVEQYTLTPVYSGEGENRVLTNFAFRYPVQFESFPMKAVEACGALLAEAEKAARTDLTRRRVQYYLTGFNVTRMMATRYYLLKEGTPLLEKPDTLARGLPFLARAAAPALDVEQYRNWAMPGDGFFVREFEPTMFTDLLVARRTAATTLNGMLLPELQKLGAASVTPAAVSDAVTRTLTQAWSQITDPAALDAAKVAVAPLVGKVVLCNRAEPPKLNGELDDACWKNAQVYSDFFVVSTGKPAAYRTEVRLCHDGKRLYLAFRCVQDTKVLLAWTRGRDDRVWREDGVEFVVNRLADTTADQRCHVGLSTEGHIWDFYNGRDSWNGDIATGIKIEPDAYTIEVSFPLDEIGLDPVRDRFLRFNMVRNVYARKTLGMGNALETSTWYLSDSNIKPESRGWLVFNP